MHESFMDEFNLVRHRDQSACDQKCSGVAVPEPTRLRIHKWNRDVRANFELSLN